MNCLPIFNKMREMLMFDVASVGLLLIRGRHFFIFLSYSVIKYVAGIVADVNFTNSPTPQWFVFFECKVRDISHAVFPTD